MIRPGSQFFKFVIIGGSAFVFDIFLTDLQVRLGEPAIWAGIASFVIVSIYNFAANRAWTFAATDGKLAHQGAKFGIISGIGAAGHIGIYSGLTLLTGQWLVAKVVAAGTVMIWNFVGHKYWTFRKKTAND